MAIAEDMRKVRYIVGKGNAHENPASTPSQGSQRPDQTNTADSYGFRFLRTRVQCTICFFTSCGAVLPADFLCSTLDFGRM